MMNVQRLRESIDLLIQAEDKLHLQEALTQLRNHLQQLSQSPQDPNLQTQLSNSLNSAEALVAQLRNQFTPAQLGIFDEIKATDIFLLDIPNKVGELLRENPATPAVTANSLNQMVSSRDSYLNTLRGLRDRLEELGVEAVKLVPGEVELGVTLPRNLFDNQLDELVGEMRALNRLIRVFSEFATGAPEAVQIKQVSTSGLEFLLGLNPATAVMIGGVVTWALSTWKQVEDIRKVRAETQKLTAFTEQEIENFFANKIQQSIETAITQKIGETVFPDRADAGRQNELRQELEWALKYTMSHIERGMTVEIRVVPPPASAQPADQEAEKQEEHFEALQQLAPQLRFPPAEPSPILPLPPVSPGN